MRWSFPGTELRYCQITPSSPHQASTYVIPSTWSDVDLKYGTCRRTVGTCWSNWHFQLPSSCRQPSLCARTLCIIGILRWRLHNYRDVVQWTWSQTWLYVQAGTLHGMAFTLSRTRKWTYGAPREPAGLVKSTHERQNIGARGPLIFDLFKNLF